MNFVSVLNHPTVFFFTFFLMLKPKLYLLLISDFKTLTVYCLPLLFFLNSHRLLISYFGWRRTSAWDGEGPEGWKPTKRSNKAPVTTTSKSGVYSSKSGSKSFDELDDILCNEGNGGGGGGGGGRGGKSRTGSKKRNRRTLSSVSSTDVFNAKESNSYNSQNIPLGNTL